MTRGGGSLRHRGEIMSVNETTTIVSISEMANMVGLSRARFYQLIGTTFPWPRYDVASRRPFYDEEGQRVCLEVRRRNCGVDGKPLMFYSRRLATTTAKRRTARPATKKANGDNYGPLIEGLKSLGLAVTAAQVEAAVKGLFPNGVDSMSQGEVLRAVFLQVKRQDSADNVGR